MSPLTNPPNSPTTAANVPKTPAPAPHIPCKDGTNKSPIHKPSRNPNQAPTPATTVGVNMATGTPTIFTRVIQLGAFMIDQSGECSVYLILARCKQINCASTVSGCS